MRAEGLTGAQVAEALRVGAYRAPDGTWWERCSCCGEWHRSARLEQAAREATVPKGMEPDGQ